MSKRGAHIFAWLWPVASVKKCKQARQWHVTSVNKCHLNILYNYFCFITRHSTEDRILMSYYEAYGRVNVNGIHLVGLYMEKYFNLNFHVKHSKRDKASKTNVYVG